MVTTVGGVVTSVLPGKAKITGGYHDTNIPILLSFFVSNGRLYARIKTVDIDKNEMKLDILAERLIEWVDQRLKPALENQGPAPDVLLGLRLPGLPEGGPHIERWVILCRH